jgi:hypothetical protein
MAGSPPQYHPNAAWIGFDDPTMSDADSSLIQSLQGALSSLCVFIYAAGRAGLDFLLGALRFPSNKFSR